MIVIAPEDVAAIAVGTAVALVIAVAWVAACLWWQDQQVIDLHATNEEQAAEIEKLTARLDAVHTWAVAANGHLFGDAQLNDVDTDVIPQQEPEPAEEPASEPGDEPATVVSHPASMRVRKQQLLDRLGHHGQHRDKDGGVPASHFLPARDA